VVNDLSNQKPEPKKTKKLVYSTVTETKKRKSGFIETYFDGRLKDFLRVYMREEKHTLYIAQTFIFIHLPITLKFF
jgi:hypothetical protein